MASPGDDILVRFGATLAGIAGVPALANSVPEHERRATLLRVARDIAHASERQSAPLATYLAGRYVELRRQDGVDEDEALGEVAAAVGRVTGAPPD
jgi:hypothetical protein